MFSSVFVAGDGYLRSNAFLFKFTVSFRSSIGFRVKLDYIRLD